METTMQNKTTIPPWPYQTMEKWRNARKEEEKPRSSKPFYPDFNDDVFAGVI
ncbi:MAG: hypothetical protein NTZ13_02120 [Candidatus Parcubacteria bacterium]|nr:hypothetical protein [Candidatus Parcubacteria bacterium]